MIVTELQTELKIPPSKAPRSEGVHLSSIIRSIAGATGILDAKWVEDLSLVDAREITDPLAILRICIGLAWEEWYLPQLRDVVDHPTEMHLEGVYMSPDGESVDVIITELGTKNELVCVECKATYKSTKTVGDMSSQWMWLTQLKGYCKGLGTRFAKIHVLFLCGDYKFPIQPVLKCWQIEFTETEINETWQLMLDYRDYRMAMDEEETTDAEA